MLNAYIKKERERESSGSLAHGELGVIAGYCHCGCDWRWSSWRSCGNWAPMERHCRSCKHRSPSDCGGFAECRGALISTVACGLLWLRAKEDSWGSITCGALSRGVLAVRSGPLDVGGSAMMVGILLTPILLMRHPTQQFHNAPSFLEDPSQLPPLRRVPRP
ncbi:hypothetical protein R6Z07F_007363 [Ovis aries]|nr:mitochondrial import inner membrane translocase subunit Tim17-B-like [Ovis aries]